MNKTELVKKVAAENEITQKAAAAAVDSVLNSIVLQPAILRSSRQPRHSKIKSTDNHSRQKVLVP